MGISPQVSSVGMIGSGMIGDSLSVLTTGHGCPTVILIRDTAKIPGYKAKYDAYFRELIDHGVLTEAQFHICETYLRYTDDYAALADCEIIFECISENLAQKHGVYAAIEQHCPHVRAICSVSSSFLPDALSEGMTKYADRIVVTHPFHPAHMVPYFEICGGSRTAPEVIPWVKSVLEGLDRKPAVLKKPVPGFIGNYLQFALWAAALKLVEDGVCGPEDVDTCLNYSFCPRYTSIGIFEHFDHGGYRLNAAACDNIFPALPRFDAAPDSIREKAASPDAWGADSPKKLGFYDWNGTDDTVYQERVNAPYWNTCRWDFPDAEYTF